MAPSCGGPGLCPQGPARPPTVPRRPGVGSLRKTLTWGTPAQSPAAGHLSLPPPRASLFCQIILSLTWVQGPSNFSDRQYHRLPSRLIQHPFTELTGVIRVATHPEQASWDDLPSPRSSFPRSHVRGRTPPPAPGASRDPPAPGVAGCIKPWLRARHQAPL